MEQNIDNKIDFKSRIINFYKENKIKTQLFFIVIIIFFISIILSKAYYEKKNNQVSELFINAGIFYTQDEKDKSKKIYEDILKSNNRFYSTLALNNIIEKNRPLFNERVKKSVEWNKTLMDPIFLGLRDDELYNKLNPDRYIY